MERVKLKTERVKLNPGGLVPPISLDEHVFDGIVRIEPPPKDPRNSAYHVPTQYTRRQVELMSAYGIPRPSIANIIGISLGTLEARYDDELVHGPQRATIQVAHRLFDTATRGEGKEALTAMIFWLKTRGGWRETVSVNHSGSIEHDHTHRAISHEERAARVLQVFAAAAVGGTGRDVVQHLRAMVAAARPADPGVPQPG